MSPDESAKSPLRVSVEPIPKLTRSAHTRAAILNAAFEFLWVGPFRELSITSLMASTHLGRSVFYKHFTDLHEVMETLLEMVQGGIVEVTKPWYVGVGDPTVLLQEGLGGLVQVGYERGPFLRAITDAATTDETFEAIWNRFMEGFDDTVTARIEADQAQGLIADFDVRPVAIALNRLNASTLIQAFGQHPRSRPEPVLEALTRIWVSTLYGDGRSDRQRSTLVRT